MHRPVVRQRLHHRQGDPRPKGRSGQGQGHPEEGGGARAAQHPRGLEGRAGQVQQGGPHGEEDIGIEGYGQHEGGPAGAADLERQVLAGRLPQARPERPCDIQQVSVAVGDGEGGHGQGQGERPGEQVAAREAVHHHQPGGQGARHRRQEADGCGEDRRGQGVAEDVPRRYPRRALAGRRRQDAQEGQEDQGGGEGGQKGDRARALAGASPQDPQRQPAWLIAAWASGCRRAKAAAPIGWAVKPA